MKLGRYLPCLFFILFVVNIGFIHASKPDTNTLFKEYLTKAQTQLEQSNVLMNSCSLVPQTHMEEKIALLEKAIACCQQAIK